MYLFLAMTSKKITSSQNPFIKQLVLLKDKAKARKKTGQFIIEGKRELELAIRGGYVIDTVLFYPEIFNQSDLDVLPGKINNRIEISKEVYQKLAHRDTTEGVIAVANTKNHTINNLSITNSKPLILVAEAPEKPGNIGALLRTADAANVDAVIIANPKTDLYNPNIIRSSVGCIFTNTIVTGSTSEIISYLQDKNIALYCATLQASVDYFTQDFTEATALVVGTEAIGLTHEWREASTQNIIIPMQGEIDSMNVSVAAGILIFEAKRQRGFK